MKCKYCNKEATKKREVAGKIENICSECRREIQKDVSIDNGTIYLKSNT